MQSKALIDDPVHYMKSFEAFSASSSKFDIYANWIDTIFSEAVVAKLGVTLQEGEELRILGVGSGSGEMDCMMIKKLLQRYPTINNRVAEPLQEMIVKYKAFAQSQSSELRGVTFDWRQQTIEQYEKAGDLATFHFISMVHSMLHINDVSSTLMYLYDRLEPGGVLFVILEADTSGFRRFRKSLPQCCLRDLSSTEFWNFLDQRNVRYVKYHELGQMEIATCFDEASEEGNLTLDFLTHQVKFRESAQEDLKRRVMERLGSSECSKKIGGKLVINMDWDAGVMYKAVSSK